MNYPPGFVPDDTPVGRGEAVSASAPPPEFIADTPVPSETQSAAPQKKSTAPTRQQIIDFINADYGEPDAKALTRKALIGAGTGLGGVAGFVAGAPAELAPGPGTAAHAGTTLLGATAGGTAGKYLGDFALGEGPVPKEQYLAQLGISEDPVEQYAIDNPDNPMPLGYGIVKNLQNTVDPRKLAQSAEGLATWPAHVAHTISEKGATEGLKETGLGMVEMIPGAMDIYEGDFHMPRTARQLSQTTLPDTVIGMEIGAGLAKGGKVITQKAAGIALDKTAKLAIKHYAADPKAAYDLYKLSREHDLGVSLGEITQNPTLLKAESLFKDMPFNPVGKQRNTYRKPQIREAAEAIIEGTYPQGLGVTTDTLLSHIQKNYDSYLTRARNFYDSRDYSITALESLVHEVTGRTDWQLPASTKGVEAAYNKLVPKNNLQQGPKHLPEQLLNSTAGKILKDGLAEKIPFQEMVNLQKLLNELYTSYKEQKARGASTMTKSEFQSFNTLRAAVRKSIKDATQAKNIDAELGLTVDPRTGRTSRNASHPMRELTKNIEQFHKIGNEKFAETQRIFDNKVVRKFIGEEATPDKLLSVFADPAKPSNTKLLLASLDNQGKASFRALVMKSLLKRATDESGTVSGQKLRNAIDNIQSTAKAGTEKSTFDLIFTPKEAQQIKGFGKLLHAMDLRSSAHLPETGTKVVPFLVMASKWTAVPAYVYSYLSTNKTFQAKMMRLSRMRVGTPEFNRVYDEIVGDLEKDGFTQKLMEALKKERSLKRPFDTSAVREQVKKDGVVKTAAKYGIPAALVTQYMMADEEERKRLLQLPAFAAAAPFFSQLRRAVEQGPGEFKGTPDVTIQGRPERTIQSKNKKTGELSERLIPAEPDRVVPGKSARDITNEYLKSQNVSDAEIADTGVTQMVERMVKQDGKVKAAAKLGVPAAMLTAWLTYNKEDRKKLLATKPGQVLLKATGLRE